MNSKINDNIQSWPDAKDYPKSIRFHFSIYVAVMVLALMTVTGVVISGKYTSVVTQSIVEKLLAQGRSYSGSASKHLLTADQPDALMLNNICRRMSDESPDIFWVAISDVEEKLVAHTNVRQLATTQKMKKWNSNEASYLVNADEGFRVDNDTVRIVIPIKEQDIVVGKLELAASADQISSARVQSIVTVTTVTIIIMLIGIPLTMFLTHRKLRPITTIAEHLRNNITGDLRIEIPINEKNEFGYLADTLHVMGEKIGEAQNRLVEQERMEKELEIAREIQTNILPKNYPTCQNFETFGYYRSAKEVGGDYFDFVDIDSEHLGVLVADVSGKSLPGMLVMLMTRDIVKQACSKLKNPDEILTEVNNELKENIKRGMFVTMFFGVLNKSTGHLKFSSAGHNPLIHYSQEKGTIDLYKPKGFPLGLMVKEQFEQRIEISSIKMNKGDVILQYSDGINEALNVKKEEFGMEKLISVFSKSKDNTAEKIINSIIDRHNTFVGSETQYDDITLLTLKWTQPVTDSNKEFHDDRRTEIKCT